MTKHCCEMMSENIELNCDKHNNPFDCADVLIHYSKTFDEYGIIIHDGGSSYVGIDFCPFCGTKLPESKRDLYFSTLEKLGFDNPWEQDIPEEFNSNLWYKNKK